MMEQEYWERFLSSGKVEDYLEYKGMEICSSTIAKYESGIGSECDAEGHPTAERSTWKNGYSQN